MAAVKTLVTEPARKRPSGSAGALPARSCTPAAAEPAPLGAADPDQRGRRVRARLPGVGDGRTQGGDVEGCRRCGRRRSGAAADAGARGDGRAQPRCRRTRAVASGAARRRAGVHGGISVIEGLSVLRVHPADHGARADRRDEGFGRPVLPCAGEGAVPSPPREGVPSRGGRHLRRAAPQAGGALHAGAPAEISPVSYAQITAWTRSRRPSFASTLPTCVFTVCSDDRQVGRDLGVGQAPAEQQQRLAFACGQRVQPAPAGRPGGAGRDGTRRSAGAPPTARAARPPPPPPVPRAPDRPGGRP